MANGRLHGRIRAGRRGGAAPLPLWLPVVIAPLLAGTAERPYTLYVAALCALSGLWAAVRAVRRSERLSASFFAVALGVAIAATLLQCVPLPAALRAALAPGSDAVLRQLRTAGSGQAWEALPLSIDPAATAHEAVRLGGYLCLLLALGTLRSRRGFSLGIGWVIAGSSSLVAALGALAALGVPLPALWAIPADGATRALLPAVFYNSNHMAALLAAGATMTVGTALQAERLGQRLLCALLLAVQNLALLGTLSRAGITVGLLSQLVVLWRGRWGAGRRGVGLQAAAETVSSTRARAQRPVGGGSRISDEGGGTERFPPERLRRPWRSLALVGGPLLAVALIVAANPAWLAGLQLRFAAISRAELLAPGSKVRAWLDALPLLAGHWALGVGRGAFEDAFAGYHRLAGATRFVYLENQWLQALVDWGVPVGLGLAGLLGLALRDAGRELGGLRGRAAGPGSPDGAEPVAPAGQSLGARASSPVRQAALVAFIGLLLHDTFDFSLEVGGVAVAAVALAALIERPRFTVRPQWALGLAAATLGGAAAVFWLCPSHEADGARLRALAESSAHSAAEVVALGTQAVRRHPLDSYLYATVAARLRHDRQPAAVLWINRALSANPRDLLARRTSALMLFDSGHRSQALRTLALAIPDGDRAQRRWLLQTALAMARAPAELLSALPDAQDELPPGLTPGLVADELLELLGAAGAAAGPPWPLVRAVAEWGQARGAQTALSWLGRAVLAQHDVAAAASLLGALKRAGSSPLLLGDLLTLLVDAGALDAAEQLLTTVLADERSAEVLLAAARVHEQRGRLPAARELLDVAQTAAATPALRGRVHEVRAELEARAGNLHRAQLEREAAAHLRP